MHLQHYVCFFLLSFRNRDWFDNLLSSDRIGKVAEHFSIMYCSACILRFVDGYLCYLLHCKWSYFLFVICSHETQIEWRCYEISLAMCLLFTGMVKPTLDTVKRMNVCPIEEYFTFFLNKMISDLLTPL